MDEDPAERRAFDAAVTATLSGENTFAAVASENSPRLPRCSLLINLPSQRGQTSLSRRVRAEEKRELLVHPRQDLVDAARSAGSADVRAFSKFTTTTTRLRST